MNLSEHFTKEEFEYSDTARARGIKNVMDDAQTKAAKHFCVYVLEVIRKLLNEKYGKVIIKITSGFRGASLNKAIGGSNTSQHCCNKGCSAADIDVFKIDKNGKKSRVPVEQVYQDIKGWMKAGKVSFDQLILEVVGSTKWNHVGTKDQLKDNRKMCMKYNGKSYVTDPS